jgi:hypothetical protein
LMFLVFRFSWLTVLLSGALWAERRWLK